MTRATVADDVKPEEDSGELKESDSGRYNHHSLHFRIIGPPGSRVTYPFDWIPARLLAILGAGYITAVEPKRSRRIIETP